MTQAAAPFRFSHGLRLHLLFLIINNFVSTVLVPVATYANVIFLYTSQNNVCTYACWYMCPDLWRPMSSSSCDFSRLKSLSELSPSSRRSWQGRRSGLCHSLTRIARWSSCPLSRRSPHFKWCEVYLLVSPHAKNVHECGYILTLCISVYDSFICEWETCAEISTCVPAILPQHLPSGGRRFGLYPYSCFSFMFVHYII